MEPDATTAPDPGGFSLDIDEGDDAVTVTAHGEIDLDTSVAFAEALAECTAARRVDIDLADVAYMDSAGLRALLIARAEAEQRGGRLRVVNASSIVSRLLQIAGVTDVFDGGS
jgi:anti-sigma B factor antagonist